jgi:predicted glycoside hydrolase/deacetylase ChbG (UPF0249 family)
MNNPGWVIINADDFGYSQEVNEAICKSFEEGIISSTSLLVNMPGFADAVSRIHTHPLLQNGVGLHINLVEGTPTSDLIKKQKRFCSASEKFAYQRNKAVFHLGAEEKKALWVEVKAQVDRALSHGIPITHVDSHHGTHTEWGISRIILDVLKQYKIEKVRIARNMGARKDAFKEVYKSGFNAYLRLRRFKGVERFGDLEDFLFTSRQHCFGKEKIEIMVHPVAAENGTIRDLDCDDIKRKIKPILEQYTLKGYCQL